MRGKKETVRKKEKVKKEKKKKVKTKRKNTWTPFSTRSSQTNESIKKCETSAGQNARQRSKVCTHNGGHTVEGVGMMESG